MRHWIWLAALAACRSPRAAESPPAGPARSAHLASNLLRGDYAGSAACADCHPAIYAAWERSAMHGMTRDAKTAAIRAPFDGAMLQVGSDRATMTLRGGERVVEIATQRGAQTYRVTKVVGGHYREDFVGVAVRGDAGGGDDGIAGPGAERVLPATYVFSTGSWRYKGYSVMVKERPAIVIGGRWSRECLPCHNTLPLATMLYDDLDPRVPAYQGKLSDRAIPRARAWTARALDAAALGRALDDDIAFLGGAPRHGESLHDRLSAAALANQQHLDGDHVIELGIGCEACHNGARVHAEDPTVAPSFAVASAALAVIPPGGQAGTRAQWINHTCAKCHTVLFSQYPWTWEGGTRSHAPGGSSISSGEGRDYQLGGCATQMACTACHDPHATDRPARLAELATPAGNAICTACHVALRDREAEARHTHHGPGSAGTACLACHMPKKTMGLDYALIRYHRIGSPSDVQRVVGDRPVECALCHGERSVEDLVSTIERWWGRRYDRAALRALYGDDLTVNVLRATLARGKPHEQAVAIAVLGQSGDRTAIPAIAAQLAHEYPLVRYFAQRALVALTGAPVASDARSEPAGRGPADGVGGDGASPLSIDVGAPAADVRRAAAAWLTAAQARR